MKFPAKVVRGYMLTVPKNVRERLGISIGDDVDVDIQLVPNTDKEKFDSHFRRGD